MRMPCYDRPLPDTYAHTPATLYRMPMRITILCATHYMPMRIMRVAEPNVCLCALFYSDGNKR